jgi:hypothetical protein
MLRVSVPINLDCEHLVLSFWMVGVGEMTNLCNHQANRHVSAAVSPTIVFKNNLTVRYKNTADC